MEFEGISHKAEQLSGDAGVISTVSSLAIEQGVLGGSPVPNQGSRVAVSPPATLDPGGDAEVMLRVKAGDEQAFA
jgi:hypothetical protein